MTLPADEFLRRFVQHVLPKRFVRVRSFGLLANRTGGKMLSRCRQLLATPPPDACATAENSESPAADEGDGWRCPQCRQGRLRQVGEVPRPPVTELVAATYSPQWFDTS